MNTNPEENDILKSLTSESVLNRLNKLNKVKPKKRQDEKIEEDSKEPSVKRKGSIELNISEDMEISKVKEPKKRFGQNNDIHRKRSSKDRANAIDRFVSEFEIPCSWKNLHQGSYKTTVANQFFDSLNKKGFSDLDVIVNLTNLGINWGNLPSLGWKVPDSFSLNYIEKVWEHLIKICKQVQSDSSSNDQTKVLDTEKSETSTVKSNMSKYKKMFGIE